MRRALLTAVLVLTACGESGTPGTRMGSETDSLVVLILQDSVPLSLAPRDWIDLFHPRFSDRVAFPDPGDSPASREFMEAVMRAEAARTGDPAAGFDWLRRLDRAVLFYSGDPAQGVSAFRRGEVVLLVLEASHAAELLEVDGVVLAPMESGAAPFPALAPGDGPGEGPDPPSLWLATWRAEVRGRG